MSSRAQRADRQLELGKEPDAALSRLDGELWLARRLGKHGVLIVFDGVTDPETRMQRMRAAIVDRGLDQIICGSKGGKPVRYHEAFERLYGVKL